MKIHRRRILSLLGGSPALLAGSAQAADRKKAEREILQPAQDKDAGFPSFVRAGRMTILIGSSASLLTLFGERSNYRNAVDAKRVPAWLCV